jgi:RNA polymerase sigma-70 factor (ECF subfamily)
MSDPHLIAFEKHRAMLLGLAYRLMGTMAEAEDMVQEAYLRWQEVDPSEVRNPPAFLNTVVTRLCMDQLRSARSKRTQYVGQWLPEPVATDEHADVESISMALMVVLERLSPAERAVYVLHQIFDYTFPEIAEITGKRVANCRQIFRRARQHVAAARPRFRPSLEDHRAMVSSFMAACQNGDLDGLRGLLSEQVTLTSDGGGHVRAITRPLEGAEPVARFFGHLYKRAPAGVRIEVRDVNGAPAAVVLVDEVVDTALFFEIDDGRVVAIHAVRNPEKLGHVLTPVFLH